MGNSFLKFYNNKVYQPSLYWFKPLNHYTNSLKKRRKRSLLARQRICLQFVINFILSTKKVRYRPQKDLFSSI
jgi:hypothetical protein